MLHAPIPYQGSKRRELDIIEKYQPQEFDKVIDAFGGGGSVSLFYLQSYVLDKVVYNDAHEALCNMFVALKSVAGTTKIQSEIRAIPMTKTEYVRLHEKGIAGLTPAELYFKYRTAMRGIIGSNAPSRMKKKTYAVDEIDGFNLKLVDDLAKYPAVLKDLTVENKNALDLIEEYKDDEYAFIYCDPPYLSNKIDNSSYASVNVDDLLKLSKVLNNPEYKCKIMLHIDFSGWLYMNFKDKIRHIYPTNYNVRHGKSKNGVVRDYQAIVTNYETA